MSRIMRNQTTLRLPSELYNFICGYATKKGISTNALMVTILDEFIQINHLG